MNIHPNSLTAYRLNAKERKSLETKILNLMSDGRPRTDRQITKALRWPDKLNPRITALVQLGSLDQLDNVKCRVTKRKVRRTSITPF